MRQYIVIVSIPDDKRFNDLVDAEWTGLPPIVEGFRISEATTYSVTRKEVTS